MIIFSIIIPAYNCNDFISQCVSSITSQQSILQDKIEILIINDASTDGSASKIRNLQKIFPNVRILFNKKNKGVSLSRNKGIKNALG